MNAFARFQLALNHEDPDVVIEGLNVFRNHILKEHGAFISFGYLGRSFYKDTPLILHPNPVEEVEGLLLSFIKSSPQCEEMFILWSLTGSNESKELCASQMSCFAAILHCARSNESYCNILVHRILSEFSKSIHLQLNSGHMHLIHSTLGLCIEMGRSNSQNCRDLYQRIMYTSNNNIFVTMLQKGKVCTLEIGNEERRTSDQVYETLTTDSRSLIIILIFLVLESADQSIATEFTHYNSLYKKALNGIYKDSNDIIKLILEGIIAVQIQPIYAGTKKIQLLDKNLISNVFDLYKNEDESVQEIAQSFNFKQSQDLANLGSSSSFKSGSTTNALLNHFIQSLHAHKDLRHRELQDILLASQPSLLPKCLQTLSIEWEPKANFEYFCAFSHLIYLISNAPIDKQIKRSLRNAAVSLSDQSDIKVAINEFLKHIAPTCLLRKDFAKVLLHPNCMVQRLGLSFLLSACRRVKVYLGNFYRSHSFTAYFNVAIGKIFPDFQTFLNLRSRYDKLICDDNSDKIQKEKYIYLLTLVYEAIDCYVVLFPSLIIESKSDLLRLLDDSVIWKQKDSAIQAFSYLERGENIFVPLILQILHSATDAGLSKWFGTQEEIVKNITNVIVNNDWIDKVKRSALAKLFLLTHCRIPNISSSAMSLVRKVFQQVGDNCDDKQTSLECIIWQTTLSIENDTIILMDILLKIHKHWFLSYCIRESVLRKKLSTKHEKLVPLSSLAFCALTICCNDFTTFFDTLPNYIQENLYEKGDSDTLSTERAFISKFRRGFCSSCRYFVISFLTKFVIYSKKEKVSSSVSEIVEVLLNESKFQKDEEDSNFVDCVVDLQDIASLGTTSEILSPDKIKKKLSDIVSRGIGRGFGKQINFLQSIILKDKKRKATDADDTFQPTSYYDVYTLSTILLNLETIIQNFSLLKNNPGMNKCLSEIWLPIADLGLRFVAFTSTKIQLVSWIHEVVQGFVLPTSTNNTDTFILLIAPMLKLMHRLSSLASPDSSAHKPKISEQNDSTKAKKRKSTERDLEDDSQIARHCRTIFILISSYIIKGLSFNNFSNVIASAMHMDFVISAISLYNDFGHFVRTILCGAANIYNRDITIKKTEIKEIPLWVSVAEELINTFDSTVNIEASVFSLGWMVQKFVDNRVLRGKFVDKVLGEVDSYALLQVPSSCPSSQVNNISYPTDNIWLSILKSASVDSLTLAAHTYLCSDSSEQHVLMGVTVGMKSCQTSTNLFEVSFYSCPLSVLKIKSLMTKRSVGENSNFDLYSSMCSSLALTSKSNDYKFCSIPDLIGYLSAHKPQGNPAIIVQSRSAIKNLISSFESVTPLKELLVVSEAGNMLDSQLVLYLLNPCNRFTGSALLEYVSRDFLFIFIRVSITFISKHNEIDIYSKWTSLYKSSLIYSIDWLLKSDSADFKDKSTILRNNCIFDLLTLESKEFDISCRGMIRDAMYDYRDVLAQKINKWLRFNLKYGLQSETSLYLLSKFMHQVVYDSISMALWSKQFDLDMRNVYDPETIIEMVVSHSKFKAFIQGEKGSSSNVHLLRFLLLLISMISNKKSQNTSQDIKVSDTFLLNILLGLYNGTMTESDRIILRILHAMEVMKKIPPTSSLCPTSFSTNVSMSKASHSSWIISAISPPIVYATLMTYPFWRSAIPQPLPLEGATSVDKYKSYVDGIIRSIAEEWASNKARGRGGISPENNDVDLTVDEYSDSDGDSNDDLIDVDTHSENDQDISGILIDEPNDDHAPYLDVSVETAPKLYDPSFWLPVLNYSLQIQDLSVRQLANTGIISLVFASLGSDCPILRTYAISILQSVFELLKKQTPDKDSAFRERPQLLMLINFVRNSFESGNDLGASNKHDTTFQSIKCYRLPLCIAIFLGRAAMHLMQPGHELYGKINKYLLSRPFCDAKDVPLYDILVTNGDSTVDNLERLIAIRLFTDALAGREDHLNLCRKNAYNRLMLLFPLLSRDIKTGHAVLDLIDKALSLRTSSRYLLERCNIIAWLQQMASPMRIITDERNDDGHYSVLKSHSKVDDDAPEIGIRGARSGIIITTAPIRLVSRTLSMMRRTIGANYLLSSEGITSYLDKIVLSIAFIIDEVINVNDMNLSSQLPLEYFRQLVLCMWECSLTAPSFSDSMEQTSWGVGRIYALVNVIQNCFKMTNDDGRRSRDDLILSLYMLTAFKCSRNNNNNRYSSNAEALLCQGLLSKLLEYQFAVNTESTCEAYVSFLPRKFDWPYASEPRNTLSSFQSVVHIFNQDYFQRVDLDMDGVINTSWSMFLSFSTENAFLPITSCTYAALSAILLKGILNMLCSTCRKTHSSEDLTSSFPLSFVRWALLLGFAHIRSTLQPEFLYPPESGSMGQFKEQCTNRILSCIDSGQDISIYSQSFQHFQLLFRLSITVVSLTLAHFNELNGPYNSGQKKAMFNALVRALGVFLRQNIKTDSFNSIAILLRGKLADDCFDGTAFWSHKDIEVRDSCKALCDTLFDMVSCVMTYHDTYTSSDKGDICTSDLVTYGPDYVLELCSKLENIFPYHDHEHNIDMFTDTSLFEANSGDEKKIIFSSTLFSDKTWRQSDKHCKEAIASGMKAGKISCLTGGKTSELG